MGEGELPAKEGASEGAPRESLGALLREALAALLVAVLLAVFTNAFLFKAFKIPTGSMEQSLLVGDHILVNKFIYAPGLSPAERKLLPARQVRRGDVVVFKFPQEPERDFIKRCVGLPSDTVQLVDKQLLINGKEVDEGAYAHFVDERVYRSRFVGERFRSRDNYGPYTVPPGHYFCLGDSRDMSRDSRFWGVVPASHVKGRAVLIYWSLSREGATPAPRALGARMRHLAAAPLRLFRQTRWSRILRIVR